MIVGSISEEQDWGVCIVGTGPVGMALALEFDRLGDEVLVLEAGGSEIDPTTTEASRAHIVDSRRHAPMEITVCRVLGGTSWTWGGRCVAYDDIDWMPRDFVADAHWPMGHDEARPWYRQASEYLLCGSDVFSIPYKKELNGGLTMDFVERWARKAKVILEHRDRLIKSMRIHLSLNTTVIALNLSSDGLCVESMSVKTPHGHCKI